MRQFFGGFVTGKGTNERKNRGHVRTVAILASRITLSRDRQFVMC